MSFPPHERPTIKACLLAEGTKWAADHSCMGQLSRSVLPDVDIGMSQADSTGPDCRWPDHVSLQPPLTAVFDVLVTVSRNTHPACHVHCGSGGTCMGSRGDYAVSNVATKLLDTAEALLQ